MAEWFKAFVLKTKEGNTSGGSNPLLSVAPCEQNALVAQLVEHGFCKAVVASSSLVGGS